MLGEGLGFFGFGPGGADGGVREEGGDEVAEEGLPVRGGAVEVPVFEGAAGHGCGAGVCRLVGGGWGGGFWVGWLSLGSRHW